MTHQADSTVLTEAMEQIIEHGLDGFSDAMTIVLNEAMRIERSRVLRAAPWERTEQRQGYANGYKDKSLDTRIGKLQLNIPQVRGNVSFYPSSLEKGLRSERALICAMAEMYIKGVSTRKVQDVVQKLCGLEVTSTQVSRACKQLDEEIGKWRNRPLGCTPFVQLDATYEKVRCDGSVVSCAILIATGVNLEGKRSVLGVSVSLSEAELHWRDFLRNLKARGLHGVEMITSDDHQGLKAAFKSTFTGTPWTRCHVHLQRNAASYVPRVHMRAEVAQDIRSIFTAPDLEEAERLLSKTVQKYEAKASRLAQWMQQSIPEGLTIFRLPPHQRRRLRSTNMLERLNKEIKRRTRVATLFPNEQSLLRLVSAILMEVSDEWEAGRIYIRMSNEKLAN